MVDQAISQIRFETDIISIAILFWNESFPACICNTVTQYFLLYVFNSLAVRIDCFRLKFVKMKFNGIYLN